MPCTRTGDLRPLTNTPDRIEFEPAWSPAGTKIVFHACSGLGTPDQHCAIYTMNADGTNETEISTPRSPYLDMFSGDRIDLFWGIPFATGSGPTIAETNSRLRRKGGARCRARPTMQRQGGLRNFRVNSGTFACPSWWDDNAPAWQATP
jgi:hypothetical protein